MRYFEVRKPRIEIIPMIDIMLFLLVFFIMMAMNMIPTSGLIGHLPSSSTSQSLPPVKVLIEIHDKGGLVVDQVPMSLDGLKTRLRPFANGKTTVTIAGGGDRIAAAAGRSNGCVPPKRHQPNRTIDAECQITPSISGWRLLCQPQLYQCRRSASFDRCWWR